ncbi:MAG: 4Fe-4S binding protein, partial [Ignavibacteria bacterium]|nr:4Fe-4S binding protein [Ignavibacteria bacterium]
MIITEKENCTGCSACKSVCPVNAIKMLEDIDGFLVPIVDDDICIKCGKCIRVCPANKDRKSKKTSSFPITYAAINKERECLKVSSSGGIFPVIANKILNNNGVVFGCAWSEQLKAEHIFIEGHNDLTKLQGSKYVQSYIGNSYINAKEFLD